MKITSLQNPRVKAAVRLRERRHRDEERLLLVEGRDELSLAIEASVEVVTLFISEAVEPSARTMLARLPAGVEVLEATREVFAKLAYRENPDGWLAIARTPDRELAALELPDAPLILVVDGVEKPGNLGAMLRTADATGVDAVILCDPGTDPWNPNVVRASKGAVFSVPLAVAVPEEVLAWLAKRGILTIAADPGASVPYTSARMAGSIAIVVGAEDTGLSEAWRSAAAAHVTIPMTGRVNSLNVATSAALLLYEAIRQRSEAATSPS